MFFSKGDTKVGAGEWDLRYPSAMGLTVPSVAIEA